MRVFTERQTTSLAAILLTVLTFALCPPDVFCRTQGSSRARSTRTVRLDDHDHDYSPDLRPDAHSSLTSGQPLAVVEAPVAVAPVLIVWSIVEFPPGQALAKGRILSVRIRPPPSFA